MYEYEKCSGCDSKSSESNTTSFDIFIHCLYSRDEIYHENYNFKIFTITNLQYNFKTGRCEVHDTILYKLLPVLE